MALVVAFWRTPVVGCSCVAVNVWLIFVLLPLQRAQVDNTTFATVLELCEGGDLEAHLQQHHVSHALHCGGLAAAAAAAPTVARWWLARQPASR
jgi:hypothetical protein